MIIDRIELHRVRLPLVRPFRTSSALRTHIEHVLVRLIDEDGAEGWGEIATAIDPFYNAETTETAWHLTRDFLGPMVIGRPWDGIQEFRSLYGKVKGNRFARSGMEMAAWDLVGQKTGQSLKTMLGGVQNEVAVGTGAGDIWLNSQAALSSAWGRLDMAHELGHALGLSHPGDYDAGGSDRAPPFLPSEEDNYRYAVLSYNRPGGFAAAYPDDYMLYDIAALQYLYGAVPNKVGDTAWQLTWPMANATENAVEMLYDTGGIDTLSISGVPASSRVVLNLNQGEFSTFGENLWQNYGICFGSVIENATGSAGDDLLIGNPANNILTGGAGADTFLMSAEWGQDTITDFAPGIDRISFLRDATLRFEDLSISQSEGDTRIVHGSDQLTLTGVTAPLSARDFYFVL